jgi:hypothetical protein
MKQVDCSDVRDTFRAGSLPDGPHCAELFAEDARLGRALAGDPGAPLPADELWKTIEGAVASETGARAWLRSRPTGLRMTLVIAVALAVIGLGASRLRSDWAVYPKAVGAMWLALYAVSLLACVWLVLAPLGRPRPPGAARYALGLAAACLPVAYALGLFEPVASATGSEQGRELVRHALGCFAYGSLLALPFLGLTLTVERRDRLSLGAVLLVAAAAGLVANTALLLHCPLDDSKHLLLGHATIGGAVFALLAAASRLVLKRR